MRKFVFISHSGNPRLVARIAAGVRKAGALPYVDELDLQAGDPIVENIFSHLARCFELVVVLTPQSLRRYWIWAEIGAATAGRRRIVGVLHGLKPSDVRMKQGGELLAGAKLIELRELTRYFKELRQRLAPMRREQRKTFRREADTLEIVSLPMASDAPEASTSVPVTEGGPP